MSHNKKNEALKEPVPPRHVAIIMDGNGRWAKERGKPRIAGHRKGAEKIEEVMRAARDCGVKYLTLYAFSSENWNRPKSEVEALMMLLAKSLKKNFKYFLENKTRFRTIGNISALPKNCVEEIEKLSNSTKDFDAYTLILALNYGSRDELVRTARKIAEASAAKRFPPPISTGISSRTASTPPAFPTPTCSYAHREKCASAII